MSYGELRRLEDFISVLKFISIVVFLIWLWLHLIISEEFGNLAESKGYSYKRYFYLAFFIGLPAYILIAAFPAAGAGAQQEKQKIQTQLSQAKSSQATNKKRLNYWAQHKEEHQALLQRKIEVAQKLRLSNLSVAERNALQRTLKEIDYELNRERP